jgi:hypothetical protein
MDNYVVMKKSTFHFDSRSRTSGTINNASFEIKKDIFQVSDSDIFLRFSLQQATVPYTFVNISDGRDGSYKNNYFKIRQGNTTLPIEIPAGNYNINQVINLVKNELNNVSLQQRIYSITLDPLTLKVDFRVQGDPQVFFQTTALIFDSGNNSLARVLGFDNVPADNTQYNLILNTSISAKQLISPAPCNVSNTTDVFIYLANLNQPLCYNYDNKTFTPTNLFGILPIAVPFYSNIIYVANTDNTFSFIVNSNSLPDVLNFQITNQQNDLLPLNRDWNLTLSVEYLRLQVQEPSYLLLEKILISVFKIAQDTDLIAKEKNKARPLIKNID